MSIENGGKSKELMKKIMFRFNESLRIRSKEIVKDESDSNKDIKKEQSKARKGKAIKVIIDKALKSMEKSGLIEDKSERKNLEKELSEILESDKAGKFFNSTLFDVLFSISIPLLGSLSNKLKKKDEDKK